MNFIIIIYRNVYCKTNLLNLKIYLKKGTITTFVSKSLTLRLIESQSSSQLFYSSYSGPIIPSTQYLSNEKQIQSAK